MNDVPSSHAPIRFGVFELDTESRELRKQGVRVRLQEQPFQILHVLLEHPGRVVTREELQQRIWPSDTFVDFDRGLYNAIKKLRGALGDSAESPRFIETLSGRGYRFIAGVTGNGSAAATQVSSFAAKTPDIKRKPRTGIVLIIAALALVGAVVVLIPAKSWQPFTSKTTDPQIRSIAVLPLQNLSADPNQEYFSDGMTDALITDLAQLGSMRVISRTSIMHYKRTDKTLPEIARELNVDGIVEGTVQRSGDLRITVQLIQGPADKHLWASTYEEDVRDVFALERNVTEDIASQVQARVITPNQRSHTEPRPVDPKVLDAYLQGNYHLSRYGEGSGQEETKQAAKYFQEAIDGDPNFAPSYVGMADAYGNVLLGSAEDAAIRRKAVERAEELDPNYSDARLDLGWVKWQPNLDWQGAEGEFRRAIALNPNSASARFSLGFLLIAMGRVTEGLQECKLAQQLNPNADESSMCFFHARDYDTSMALQKLMLKKDPSNGYLHCFLFNNYFKKGMHKEAIEEMAACARLFGFSEGAAKIERELTVSGPRAAIQLWAKGLEQLQEVHQIFMPGNLAVAYTILGDKDRAFYWLEQAYQHREAVGVDGGVFFLRSEPMYDPLRSDPRFDDLLRRVGLPPGQSSVASTSSH